ncbi:MAG TPA: glycosyltransferase [Sporichthyaceae bacterium]
MSTDVLSGAWTWSMELVSALAQRDVVVDVAVLGPGLRAEHVDEAGGRGVCSLHPVAGALEWMPEPWADVDRAGHALLALVEDLEPDVVHLGGYAHAALPWSVPVLVGPQSCPLAWRRAVRGGATPRSWDAYRARAAAGLAAADAVVAPTAAMLLDLHREYGLDRPGTVIPPGRSADWVAPREKVPLVLAAGPVWDATTNLMVLAEAAADLPWPVVIAGDQVGPDGVSVATSAPPNIALPGPLIFGALGELLARASIFAAPALYEPFGRGPVEAAQAGCALLLSDLPSLREVWGDAAWFVDPRDPAAIRAALHALVCDDALREDLGARARHRAARYTPERMASTYLYLYRELTARQRVSAGAA